MNHVMSIHYNNSTTLGYNSISQLLECVPTGGRDAMLQVAVMSPENRHTYSSFIDMVLKQVGGAKYFSFHRVALQKIIEKHWVKRMLI